MVKLKKYVEDNIGDFHQKRIQCIKKLKLSTVLRRKNPYLFRAKYVLTSEDIVKGLVDAHISSNEETLFGNWLEKLAIFINEKVFNGRKSGIRGVDLEFDKDGVRNIVAIKSGPNWGNSSQVRKMVEDFRSAKKTLGTSGSQMNVVAVNGCCYGTDRVQNKGDYFKYCGQDFWEFISGNRDLFVELIEPIGCGAREKNDDFLKSYSHLIDKLTGEFSKEFCEVSGDISWNKLVRFNSSS